MSRRQLTLALLTLTCLAACGEAEPPLKNAPDGQAQVTSSGVLVIVVDGLRWDHTTLAGYDRATTPYLEELARNAMVFSNAWSASSSLVGSHVAILSGCDSSLAQPPDSRAPSASVSIVEPTDEDAWFVPEDLWLLGRAFLGAGWTTAAFVDHPMMAELRGLDRGFREFVKFERSTPGFATTEVGRRFVRWLNHLPLDQNWLAYVHMNEIERGWSRSGRKAAQLQQDEGAKTWQPRRELAFVPPVGLTEPLFHALPPSRADLRRPVTLAEYELRYDKGIRALDRSLRRLVGTAEAYGRGDNMTIVIMGSFGSGLGEHGLYLQAGLAEDEDLHVPLLIRPSAELRDALGWEPVKKGTWRKSDALVGLVDVAPTIIDLAAVRKRDQRSARVHGVTLRPLLSGALTSVRARVFVRPSVLPGFAIVENGLSVAVYDPSHAIPTVKSSWSHSSDGDVPAAGDPRVTALWKRWENFLQHERRFLHFGVGSSDRDPVDKIRELQGATATTDGTPKEETIRDDTQDGEH